MPRPIVPAPSTATVEIVFILVGTGSSPPHGNRAIQIRTATLQLRHRDRMHPRRLLGEGAQLVGDGQRAAYGGPGELLQLRRGAQALEDAARQLVVLDLLRLDDLA